MANDPSEEAAGSHRPSTLAQKAVRGASWSIATSLGSRILGLVGTLAITHFLNPDVVGEVNDAFVLVTTVSFLSTWGFGQYLMAKPDAGPDLTWHTTFYHLVLGAIGLTLVALLGPRFAGSLHAPNLGLYLPGLIGATFADRIAMVPERLIARQMQFRTLGLARTAGELSYTIASLGLAVLGFGGMAIVWANVARSVVRGALMIAACKPSDWLRPYPLSMETTKAMLRFGLPFAVSMNAAFASRRWDNLVISHLFGISTAGSYNMAYNLADIPAVQVGEQIGDVLLPSFARMELEHRRKALVRATGLLSLIVFPLAVGLGAVAPTAIAAILPRAWHDVAPMLLILSALSVARPVAWTVGSYLVSRERTRALMMLGFLLVAVLIGSIYVLGRIGGPLWACVGVGVGFAVNTFAHVLVVQGDGVSGRAILAGCARPLLACVPLVIAVLVARWALHAVHMPAMVQLVIEVTAGAIGYVGGAFLVARDQADEFLGLLKKALLRRRG